MPLGLQLNEKMQAVKFETQVSFMLLDFFPDMVEWFETVSVQILNPSDWEAYLILSASV